MKSITTLLPFIFLCIMLSFNTNCIAQNVTLKKEKAKKTIIIISNNYSIFLALDDINQMAKSLPNSDNYIKKISFLKQGSLIDLNTYSDQELVSFLKENIIGQLLKNGNAYIEDNKKNIISNLNMDKSPVEEDLNGDFNVYIYFYEKNNTVYAGWLHTKKK